VKGERRVGLRPSAGLRVNEQSKRGSSTGQADSFARANEKKKQRLAPVGMTGLGKLAEMVAEIR
jgi:hypothetical protein